MAIRSRTSRLAHVLERAGLAAAGASCGLFVAAHLVKEGIPALMSIGFVFAMMIGGAVGFYLGIDLPPRDPPAGAIAEGARATDPVDVLSALGTFLAPVAALVAVANIILDIDPRPSVALTLALCWLAGVVMQLIAGITARFGR
jgi:hypothetical protein